MPPCRPAISSSRYAPTGSPPADGDSTLTQSTPTLSGRPVARPSSVVNMPSWTDGLVGALARLGDGRDRQVGMRGVFSAAAGPRVEPAHFAAPDPDGDRTTNHPLAVDGYESSFRAAAYAVGVARRQALGWWCSTSTRPGPAGATPDSINAIRVANAEAVRALRLNGIGQATAVGVAIAVMSGRAAPTPKRCVGRRASGPTRWSGGGRNFGISSSDHRRGACAKRAVAITVIRSARC